VTFRVQSEADDDFAESAMWYLIEEQSPQAAERFEEEVAEAYREIQKAPYRYPAHKKGIRAWPLKKFPFSILYFIEADEIVVASIYHHKRSRSFLNRRVR
jgi:plasmid stabilization system protein ParE